MKILIRNILILLILFAGTIHAQVRKAEQPIFTINPANETEATPDSILVAFWKENVSSNYGRKQLKAEKKGGKFIFKMPEIDHISLFRLIFCYGRKNIPSKYYFAEPSDRLNVAYQRTEPEMQLQFAGHGEAKYSIRDTIDKIAVLTKKGKRDISAIYRKMEAPGYCLSPELKAYVKQELSNVLTGEQKIQTILQQQSALLGREVTKFYSYEYSIAYEFLVTMNGLFLSAKSPECKQAIADLYFSKKGLLEKPYDDPMARYSVFYAFYKGVEVREEAHFKTKTGAAFAEIYKHLKGFKPADLKERLITQFFLNPALQRYAINLETRDSCLKDAHGTVINPVLKQALREQLVFAKGSEVYPFSFTDTLGKYTSLADMKGKVFLMDFYGEGCSGCAVFSKIFKKAIYPEFADNTDFAVLSISVDRTKERWLKAMKSGLYTQPGFIQLNTGPDGINHPMLKYYNLNSIPLLLLVDQSGKLIAKIDSQSTVGIGHLIRNALIQNSETKLAE